MGDATRHLDAKREWLLAQLDLWGAPDSDEERQLVREIGGLQSVIAPMANEELLISAGMKAGQSHQNCRFMERNDPVYGTKAITGWWSQGNGIYVHHSVINVNGNWMDVTPPPAEGVGDRISFLPDPAIVWVDEDGVVSARRNGRRVPKLARADAQFVVDQCIKIRARLARGMHPDQAMLFETTPGSA